MSQLSNAVKYSSDEFLTKKGKISSKNKRRSSVIKEQDQAGLPLIQEDEDFQLIDHYRGGEISKILETFEKTPNLEFSFDINSIRGTKEQNRSEAIYLISKEFSSLRLKWKIIVEISQNNFSIYIGIVNASGFSV